MPEVRYLISGRVEDADAYRDLARRMSAYARENEPGTKIYNWFLSEDGASINEDGFSDSAAFKTHLANAGEQGFFDEFMSLLDIESVRVLGEVDDAATEALAAFGAIHYELAEGL